ncbi:MAG: pirin family protein [Neptuniibacter sp.]
MNKQHNEILPTSQFNLSNPISGRSLNIGTGFQAQSYKHDQFDGLMDPLLMLDHFTMTEPTFGAHPHAGMSAVTVLFEDSKGIFNNQDSLGNNADLKPGDAYWLKAGNGAIHDEKPTSGSRTHGLQIFVNLPQQHKHDSACSLHVPSENIPVITSDDYRIRVVFGKSNTISGAIPPSLPLSILDTYLNKDGQYNHAVEANQTLFIYAVSESVTLHFGQHSVDLHEGQAIAIQTGLDSTLLKLSSSKNSHVVILEGAPIRESFVQKGPFVMNTTQEISAVTADYEAGKFGSIPS